MNKRSIVAAIALAGVGISASAASAQVRVRDHRAPGQWAKQMPVAERAAQRTIARSPIITGMSPGYGDPGDLVTIEGRFFKRNTMVRFGDELVTPIRQNGKRIVFRIPARNGSQLWRERSPVQVVLTAPRGADMVVGTFQLNRPHIARPTFESLPPVKAEIDQHNQRMGKLQRIRKLAASESYDGLVRRVDALIARETLRHQQAMANLETRYARYRG